MKEYLKDLPKEVLGLIEMVSDTSAKANVRAYLVGGFVRDLILGVGNLDLDIVVEGDAIRFAEQLMEHRGIKITAHKRFGTATLTFADHKKIDVASARRESYPEPAQLPEVRNGSLEDDLYRRDFTINAMAVSLNKADFGKLVDLYAGIEDIRRKKIRILHDLSFIDDPTRIMRAIRFEQRLNFRIESHTLAKLNQAVKQKMLNKVEPQRLRDDLTLILKENDPIKEVKRMIKLCGFSFINKRLKIGSKDINLLKAIAKEVFWFKRNFPHRRHIDSWLMYLIGLLDPLSTLEAEDFCLRFALRRGEVKRILSYKNIDKKFIAELKKASTQPSKVFTMLEPLSYEVMLLVKAKYRDKLIQKMITNFLEILNGMRIHVSGKDLKDLGLAPGSKYQKIFNLVLRAKLEGKVKTRADELVLIRKIIQEE
jgi:tRNA nucleotidyltransferase (CCA-adding enzyme)